MGERLRIPHSAGGIDPVGAHSWASFVPADFSSGYENDFAPQRKSRERTSSASSRAL